MYKQILLLLLVVAVVKSQVNNAPESIEGYINQNRLQYASNIKSYDLQILTFERSYAQRLNNINTTTEMLKEGLIQNDKHLNPLEILGDFSKQCIIKYRSSVPTISYVKTTINSCILMASQQVMPLLANPRITRNNLEYYYANTFEKEIKNCNTSYWNSQLNYNMCVTNVISTTNTFTMNNQKSFASQMTAAEHSADVQIVKSLDCSISAQNRATYLIAEANTLIDVCLQGLDNCKRSVDVKSTTNNKQ